jgi:hypothetical protein
VADNRHRRIEFAPLLKRKFVQRADKYPFLDPFAAEFEYVDQEIRYSGVTDDKTLSTGVLECCRELAEELGLLNDLRERLNPWLDEYGSRLAAMGLSF